jgi:NedA-like, galactose-binding domain
MVDDQQQDRELAPGSRLRRAIALHGLSPQLDLAPQVDLLPQLDLSPDLDQPPGGPLRPDAADRTHGIGTRDTGPDATTHATDPAAGHHPPPPGGGRPGGPAGRRWRARHWITAVVVAGTVGAAAAIVPSLSAARHQSSPPSGSTAGAPEAGSRRGTGSWPGTAPASVTGPSGRGSAAALPPPSPTARETTTGAGHPLRPAPGGGAATSSPPGGQPNTSGRNLARDRPTIASSEESAHFGPGYAVDGDTSSRWGSARADPQWISVDLGALWSITRVQLIWQRSYANRYHIDVSRDGTTWSTVFSTSSGTGGTDTIPVGHAAARYVRMYGTSRATSYGYSLFEFSVF